MSNIVILPYGLTTVAQQHGQVSVDFANTKQLSFDDIKKEQLDLVEDLETLKPTSQCTCDVISNHKAFDLLHSPDCPRYKKSEEYV